MNVLDPILDQISKLWSRVDLMPTMRWGTVTGIAPLSVQLDGDAAPLPFPPSTVIFPLRQGARVLCVEQNRRVTVVSAEIARRGTTAQRNAAYGVPASASERAALANLKPTWFNTDLGWEESYYAVTGTSGLTAPGLAINAPAGWYPVGYGPHGRLQAAGAQSHVSGQYFTNWMDFGNANASGESWRSHTLIDRPGPSDLATIRTNLAGRYEVEAEMYFQNGSGTGVWEFSYLDGVASQYIAQNPVVLLGSYGQLQRLKFKDVLLFPTGRCYARTVAATWALGNAASWMSMRYVGPPLVNA